MFDTATAPLRGQAFRGICIGSACSALTDGIIPVAFAVYSVQRFGGSGALSVVLVSLWVGRFLCVPLAGTVASRYDRFAVMILADLARIGAQAGLALFLVVAGDSPAMAVSAAGYGVATAFYGPASAATLPEIVSAEQLRPANAILAVILDISVLIGPAAAVILFEALGFFWILLLDSATFGLNILALVYARRARMCNPGAPAGKNPDKTSDDFGSFRAIVGREPWLGWSVGLWFTVSFVIGMVAVAGPTLTVGANGGAGLWAMLTTGTAVASLAGSLSLVAALRRFGWRLAAVAMTGAVACEAGAVAGYSDRTVLGPIALFAGCVMAGFAISAAGIVWQALLQARLSTSDLARFGSVEGFVNAVGVPIGMTATGPAFDSVGIECVAAVAVAALLVFAFPAGRLTPPTSGSRSASG
ncbi:MFS transporter [Nocardia brevicatena]|uniref:MFS transporter n=1 Tax=Nocardia brevicatena TaxID=37327 RepID=UPI0003071B57|nr:MFS transporter [Nocardia brevicatena]